MAKRVESNTDFPFSLTLSIPLPTHRLAISALRALQVDTELSPLVQRSLSLDQSPPPPSSDRMSSNMFLESDKITRDHMTLLQVEYKATTNRMLRVAVNGFMESLSLILGVMEELDLDVLSESLQTDNS